jgi:transcriptional regulator with XRE-family HTH domain
VQSIGRGRERKLSQAALASLAGLGAKHLGEIERGNHDPRTSTLKRLADALDMDIQELWTWYEEEYAALP